MTSRLTLEPADILIHDSRIEAVGATLDAPAGAREIWADDRIILPGLINAHTHGHNNLTRATDANWTLEDLLNHGSALQIGRTVEDQYVSAAIGAIEMLKTGCTAAYDLFMAFPAPTSEGMEAVVRAYRDVGLRAVLAPAVADIVFHRTVPGLLDLLPTHLRRTVESIEAVPAEGLLRLTREMIERWDGTAGGRIRAAVAPTIPGQCTEEFLQGCVKLAREFGVGFHTHLAETKVQVIHAQQRWGTTIVDRLAQLDALGPHFVGAHGIWLTPGDIQRLADSGASVVHNPTSNLTTGAGLAPVREMLDGHLNVGLGTDGSNPSGNQNMFRAMSFAGAIGNIRSPYHLEPWIGAENVWRMATEGSAQALGMADDLGAIAPGRKADLVLLNANSVYLRPMTNTVNTLVYVETGASVETVLVDGQVVLDGGEVLTVDEAALREHAQEAADRIYLENANLRVVAKELTPYIRAACQAAVSQPYPIDRYAVRVGS